MTREYPHNIEAEQAVLGAILIDSSGDALDTAQSLLTPGDFYRATHSEIFAAMCGLHSPFGDPIDAVTLRNELTRKGIYEAMGGFAYFAQLQEATPTTANIGWYAGIVRKKSRLRQAIQTAAVISGSAYAMDADADAVIENAETAILAIDAAQSGAATDALLEDSIHAAYAEQRARQTAGGGLYGMATGFESLDIVTSGLNRGDLCVIGARPGTGKTAVGADMARRMMKQGRRVVFVSLEMPAVRIADRIICAESRVHGTAYRNGVLKEWQNERVQSAVETLNDASSGGLFSLVDGNMTHHALASHCRRFRARYGAIDAVFVDYLQLIPRGDSDKKSDERLYITETARRLALLAKQENCAVIALSQLSRAAVGTAETRPRLSHLKESGGIEEAAAVVLLLHRPAPVTGTDWYAGNPIGEKYEIDVAKNRHGDTGIVTLAAHLSQSRFEEWNNENF